MGPQLDRKRLKEIVESIDQLDLGIGVPVSFGAGKHQGLDRIYFTEVREGRFVPVADWKRWRK
jgi:hypothetical protein